MNALVEVRVVTYRRPKMLRRALESLRAQSHRDWVAEVWDDSPDREGRAVVEAFGDERIRYTSNACNLGALGNIDQGFHGKARLGGAYALLLEDDNWLYPDCLTENIEALGTSGTDCLLRNQDVWEEHRGELRQLDRTTRGHVFSEGPLGREALLAPLLFYGESLSNGGLFWRLGRGVDLRAGTSMGDARVQEVLRAFRAPVPTYFAATPQCAFYQLPVEESSRQPSSNRRIGRATQAVAQYLLHRPDAEAILRTARSEAEARGFALRLERCLADALYLRGPYRHLRSAARWKAYGKGLAKQLLVTNLTKDFLREQGS